MSEPLRIMVMTTVPITLAAFFERQLRSLSEAGFEVHAVSSPGPLLDHLDVGPLVIRHGVTMARPPKPLSDVKSLWNLYRLIRKVRPHIVHSHTPKAGMLGMLAAKIAGVPVRLYTVHGLPLETRTGIRRSILEFVERSSSRWATHVYSVSRSVRESMIALKLCPSGRVSVVGDGSCAGIDPLKFQPGIPSGFRSACNIPGSATVAVYVGRLSRDKGVDVLAKAWPTVADALPELHLLVAGEPDATDPSSEQASNLLRSHPRIHMLGNVSPAQIPSLYAAADFTVLPTFREGLSHVALESSAMAVPLVSCRVCGVVDPIVDGQTGLLVPPRDAQALASAIIQLATDAPLRHRLGAAARAYVSTHFSEARVNQLWMAEYRRLVQESFPELAQAGLPVEAK